MAVDRMPCCEPEAAIARLEGDEELYGELVAQLFADAVVLLQKLSQAISAGDSDQVHYLAHSFKGQSATCGATTVAALSAELELLGREQRLDNAAVLYDRLDGVMEQTRDELAKFV